MPAADVDDDESSEAGTQAAGPRARALAQPPEAEAAVELGAGVAGAATQIQPARPPVFATASRGPAPTAADAFDQLETPRMKLFGKFGMVAAIGAVVLTLLLGGDPLARHLFWTGAGVVAVCNLWLIWLASDDARYRAGGVSLGAIWVASTIGLIPAMLYFGPYSAVVIAPMLGITIIALSRSAAISSAVAAVMVGGHMALAFPIALGWMTDRGVLSSAGAERSQLLVAEAMISLFMAGGFGLGRWMRKTNATALAELQNAMQVIGDQQAVLAEVKDDVARAKRAGEGRWTGQQMGAFQLGLVLGRGAMGEVYEAHDAAGNAAAVKLLNQQSTASTSLVERFHREMATAARLVSPHIVRVFEISGPDAPVPFIAMERLHGTDLASRLRSDGRIPSDELVMLLDQVARGLEVARLAGVVHRDLKPHNLFQHRADGAPPMWKILDFGVSKTLGSEGTLTGEGIVGTPQYMAPEQASGGVVTHLADVYALGAIAYRCLTGRSPFSGNDLAELVYKVVHTPPVRPSTLGRVSIAVEGVLAVAMAKDPRRRFPSAQSFALAFIAARRGNPVALELPPDAWR